MLNRAAGTTSNAIIVPWLKLRNFVAIRLCLLFSIYVNSLVLTALAYFISKSKTQPQQLSVNPLNLPNNLNESKLLGTRIPGTGAGAGIYLCIQMKVQNIANGGVQKEVTHGGDRTRDHTVKSRALFRLSYMDFLLSLPTSAIMESYSRIISYHFQEESVHIRSY